MPSFLKKSSSGERFVRGTLKCFAANSRTSLTVCSIPGIWHFSARMISCCRRLRQVRQSVCALNKLFKRFLHDRATEQLTENIDLGKQFFTREQLDELLGAGAGESIKFSNLHRGG